MKVSTGDYHYDEFFYIRGVIHKGYDHIGSAGTKCGDTWYKYNSQVEICDSPQEAQDTFGGTWGGITLCPKCFNRKKETMQYFRGLEAKGLKAKAKSLLAKAQKLREVFQK